MQKERNGRKTLSYRVLASKAEQYDLLKSLEQANVGLNAVHLLRGGAENATVAAKMLFSGQSVQKILAAIK